MYKNTRTAQTYRHSWQGRGAELLFYLLICTPSSRHKPRPGGIMWRGNVEVERETGGGERHHTETDRVVNLHWTRTPCTLSGTTKQTDAAQSQHDHVSAQRVRSICLGVIFFAGIFGRRQVPPNVVVIVMVFAALIVTNGAGRHPPRGRADSGVAGESDEAVRPRQL